MSVQLVSFYYKCTFSIGMSKLYHVWRSLRRLMLLQSHLQPLTKIKLEQVKFFILYLTINALHLSQNTMTYATFKENLSYDKSYLRAWIILHIFILIVRISNIWHWVDNDYNLIFDNLGVYLIFEYVCNAHFAFIFAPSFAFWPYSNHTNKLLYWKDLTKVYE